MVWQLHEAKQKFSEVVELALHDSAQIVTRNGREVVAVISIEEYRRLTKPPMDFKEFLLQGPWIELEDCDFERQRDLPRDIEL